MKSLIYTLLLFCGSLTAGDYFVATSGQDVSSNGGQANPWKTIGYALQQIPDDGSTIWVADGIYDGRQSLDRHFAQPAYIRATTPYRTRLQNSDRVITIYDGSNITIEGFEITHSAAGGALVIHIAGSNVKNIVLRNNILHDSYNNDILKVNDLASNITINGNIFYNQQGSDEHIDINQVSQIEVSDNIFFNDFAGSGRTITGSQFVVIKNSYGNRPGGSQFVNLRRNIFLNFEGGQWGAFVRYGEDGDNHVEATDCILENNLFLDTSGEKIQAPINSNAGNRVQDIIIRNNTLNGNFPHTLAHSLRANGSGFLVHNNIWCNPSGSMGEWGAGSANNSLLQNNLYWNDGNVVPDGSGSLKPSLDSGARWENPQLAALDAVTLPRYDSSSGLFADGSHSIRNAFIKLAAFGLPNNATAVVGYADPSQLPIDDLLGNPRGNARDLGAITIGNSTAIGDHDRPTPEHFTLKQNYPNPFNPTTTIAFTLQQASVVKLEIFDNIGRHVETLQAAPLPVGTHKFIWYGSDASGNLVASGVYFYQLQVRDIQTGPVYSLRRKMLLIR